MQINTLFLFRSAWRTQMLINCFNLNMNLLAIFIPLMQISLFCTLVKMGSCCCSYGKVYLLKCCIEVHSLSSEVLYFLLLLMIEENLRL